MELMEEFQVKLLETSGENAGRTHTILNKIPERISSGTPGGSLGTAEEISGRISG